MHMPASDLLKSSSFDKTAKITSHGAFRLKCKHTQVIVCYLLRGIGYRKVSSSKSHLQGHSRELEIVPFDRSATYNFLLISIAIMSILHRFEDVITYFPKFKEVTWPWTDSFLVQFIIQGLVLFRINQHTKFEVPSFIDSRDVTGAKF